MFLEISQNSQEKTCARDSFLIKLQAYFIKKESLAQVFSFEFCEVSKNTFFQNTSGRLFLLFPHKTAYFSNNSHNAYKNADGNSKFNITKLNAWKLTFWKQLVIAKDDIKVSVILANKYEVKAKNFIIPISVYGN